MNDFTASNGRRLWVDDQGHVRGEYDEHNTVTYVRAENYGILAEFFQAEADERLGRWRWPEQMEYVVYSMLASRVRVVHEADGSSLEFTRADLAIKDANEALCAAQAYFDAHPEPKPWHDAKPGELWVIHLDDEDDEIGVSVESYDLGADVFQVPDGESISVTRPEIIAGRRIWPEVS